MEPMKEAKQSLSKPDFTSKGTDVNQHSHGEACQHPSPALCLRSSNTARLAGERDSWVPPALTEGCVVGETNDNLGGGTVGVLHVEGSLPCGGAEHGQLRRGQAVTLSMNATPRESTFTFSEGHQGVEFRGNWYTHWIFVCSAPFSRQCCGFFSDSYQMCWEALQEQSVWGVRRR